MRRTLLVGLLVVPLQVLAALPAAAAEGDPVTGWWSRTRLGPPVPVEAPAPVPEGGTWVASDPSGPLAVSALRLDLAEGVVATGLSLKVERADGTPAVRACPAVARWQPEQGGRLDSAPAHSCEVSAKAEVKGDALVVAFPAGFSEGFLDVVLTPEPGAVFSLTLQKATAASVTTQSPPPEGVTTGALDPAPPPPGLTPTGGSALPPLSTGVAAAPALPSAPAAPQAAPPAPAAAAPPVTAAPTTVTRRVSAGDRREAVPAAILFVLMAAFATYLAMQPARAPRRLGGGVGLRQAPAVAVPPEAVRGVGRFRAARSARPVRL